MPGWAEVEVVDPPGGGESGEASSVLAPGVAGSVALGGVRALGRQRLHALEVGGPVRRRSAESGKTSSQDQPPREKPGSWVRSPHEPGLESTQGMAWLAIALFSDWVGRRQTLMRQPEVWWSVGARVEGSAGRPLAGPI